LGVTVLELLRNPAELVRMGNAARMVCARERGAARRTMVLLGRIFARARYARSETRSAPRRADAPTWRT
jgi:hypothetical protein